MSNIYELRLALTVDDLDEALHFYHHALGLHPASIFEGRALLFVRTEMKKQRLDFLEIVLLAHRAQQVNKLLADLNRDITRLRQEFPLPVQRDG